MATDVSICSNALLRLGARPITSFSEASVDGGIDRAVLCNELWPTARRSLLAMHPWNCAIKRVTLAADATAPSDTDFTFQFTLPADLLRVLDIGGRYEWPQDWRVEGLKLLYDDAPIKLRYVFDNANVGTWSPILVETAEAYMAYTLAYAVNGSTSERDARGEEFRQVLRMAKNVDAQETTQDVVGDFPILAARLGGRGGPGSVTGF